MDVVSKFTPAKFHLKFYVLSILWRDIKYPKIRRNRLRKGLWSYMPNGTGNAQEREAAVAAQPGPMKEEVLRAYRTY